MPSNPRSITTRLAGEQGFSLIEVLAATLVLVAGVLALLAMFAIASKTTSTNRLRQAETSLAREVVEDIRNLAYTQLLASSLASTLQPTVSGSTVSGSNLAVTRSIYTFTVSFTACSLDDPANGYGNHSSPPQSGGSWCPDVGPSGTSDTNPDDYKRVSVTVTPTNRTKPVVQQTILIYDKNVNGPAVTCLSTTSTCPGSNLTVTNSPSATFNVTTSSVAASIQWLVNGSPPPSAQIPSSADDPYTPGGTTSSFTWLFPNIDGTYTVGARAFDANGNSGTTASLQLTLNRHQAIAPTKLTAGWDQLINGVDITWVPSIDHDILYYRVYRQVGSATPTVVCSQVNGTSCTDLTAPSPNPPALPATCDTSTTSYTTSDVYWVVGVDTNPATGLPRESTAQSPNMDANYCDHQPNAPPGLTGTLSGGTMTLNWTKPAPGDPDSWDSIQAWRIYRWPSTQGPQFPGSRLTLVGATDSSGNPVTTFADTTADPNGVQQSYCVTAVDKHLNESNCSNVVTG